MSQGDITEDQREVAKARAAANKQSRKLMTAAQVEQDKLLERLERHTAKLKAIPVLSSSFRA